MAHKYKEIESEIFGIRVGQLDDDVYETWEVKRIFLKIQIHINECEECKQKWEEIIKHYKVKYDQL